MVGGVVGVRRAGCMSGGGMDALGRSAGCTSGGVWAWWDGELDAWFRASGLVERLMGRLDWLGRTASSVMLSEAQGPCLVLPALAEEERPVNRQRPWGSGYALFR